MKLDNNDDHAIYVTFTRLEKGGTLLVATRGYMGLEIARLAWTRVLTNAEEMELDQAVRYAATAPWLGKQ